MPVRKRTVVEVAAGLQIACLVLVAALGAAVAGANAGEPAGPDRSVELSPELTALLRAEMGQITQGMQTLTLSLATGDWDSIAKTAARIQASYIMEQKLTAAQAEELAAALPEGFKRLDSEFHRRAGRLGAAAESRDAELAAFHFSRLLESCAACHAAYASARFPGLVEPPSPREHHH